MSTPQWLCGLIFVGNWNCGATIIPKTSHLLLQCAATWNPTVEILHHDMSSFWVLAFPCFKKRLSFHQGIEYHWAFYKCQLSSPNPSQVFVPLLFLWNCRSRYSTDFTHFSHLYLNTMKARHTDSILSSVLQHAISNISKLSGHGYDRFLFKYVRPPKRKGMTAVIWFVPSKSCFAYLPVFDSIWRLQIFRNHHTYMGAPNS